MTGEQGAYGFRVHGLGRAERLLSPAEPSWPSLTMRCEPGPASAPAGGGSTVTFTPAGAALDLGEAGTVEIVREPATAVVRGVPASDDALVHPYLAGAVSVLARWHDREAFHGGGVLFGSRAWGILGGQGAGKSSLLARLHADSRAVLADDVLVLDAAFDAFAGPRALDLREEASRRLGLGVALPELPHRARWRVELGAAPARAPLAGWVFLEWGERVELVPVGGAVRLQRLRAQLTTPEAPGRAAFLLELAALPVYVLRRPRSWDALAAAAAVLDVLDG